MSDKQSKKDKELQSSQYIDNCMHQFCLHYSPAQSIDQATNLLSTSEIYSALLGLNPGANIAIEQVYDAMVSSGFQYSPEPNKFAFNFKWMLISKY